LLRCDPGSSALLGFFGPQILDRLTDRIRNSLADAAGSAAASHDVTYIGLRPAAAPSDPGHGDSLESERAFYFSCRGHLHDDSVSIIFYEGLSSSVFMSSDLLADRIRRVRAWARIEQAEFARRVGFSRGYLANVESGVAPSPRFLRAVCREFGISERWLVAGDGPMRRPVEDLIKEELEKYGEQTYLEALVSLAKAKHYDELFARIFARPSEVKEPTPSYGASGGDARYQSMRERLDRIYLAGNEQTIAAIEFILKQSDPEQKKGATDES
jgi:transcriptional regulator with XRE-family HTH domain